MVTGNDCLLLSAIVDEFSTPKCKNLCGKPKLFFFLDDGTKQDNATRSLNSVKSKPANLKNTINNFAYLVYFQDAYQFTNSHAGVCVFVGVGEGLIDGLSAILSSGELKGGGKSLQTALVHLIRTTEYIHQDRTCIIKPQLISTLPVLVDFPPLIPLELNKRKILTIASGKLVLVCTKCFFFI